MFLPLLLVFLIRFVLSFLPSFDIDMGTWLGWAGRLSSLGLANFYSDATWTQYTPGFMYWLWFIGKIGWTSALAIKIPALIADLSVGLLIYSLVKKVKPKLAIISFFLYTLNPVIIFDGSVWGQIDGILTLLIFLSAYFLIEKRSLVWSIFFWSISFLIKPQAIAVLPVFFLVILLKKFKFKEIVIAAAVGMITIFGLSLPFFPTSPILGLPNLITQMIGFYNFTSVNAFNIWSWVGLWKLDTTLFLGLSLSFWGSLFLLSSITGALYVFRNKLNKKENYYLLFAVCCLCFFVFPTRVHERYLFPFFAFLLTSAGLSKSFNLFVIYIVTSILCFLNLYYPYSYYNPEYLRSDFLYNLSQDLAKIVGFLFLVTYFVLLYWEKLPKIKLSTLINRFTDSWKKRENLKIQVKFPKIALSEKKAKSILIMILMFSFVTRTYDLWSPKSEYFDEVYHAFTAKVMMGVEKAKAWEWWNTPPAGFAYEWTHPPLAKLGMVLGMSIFGQNSFGYRIPGALLGVASVFLVYLLAVEIFKDKLVGLLSAGVFSLDGLALVMSRIGMNDSYILFFTLLSIYFFLKKKDSFSALAFGFALASKWSTIWAIPILGILWLKRKNKFRLSLLWFLLLPPAIYLLTYLPMFLTGHSLSVWWDMQQQMWWYHTGLRATHPYSSQWWSWPFLIRPIYLYTGSEIGGFVSRIYAMGNPVVFWFGLASIVMSSIYSYVERNKELGFVVFCYLMFFVPWAASPRIMFFYHYLPAIPFLAIATGYILRRNPKLIFAYSLICLLVFIYFYPHWAGLNIPLWLDKSYYWIPSWR
jgi:predicted membrane-bound dolichyl-phosphate-mannose-protein mannosyltransferase